jgi:hypothetical protein
MKLGVLAFTSLEQVFVCCRMPIYLCRVSSSILNEEKNTDLIVAGMNLYPICISIGPMFQTPLVDDWQNGVGIIRPNSVQPVTCKRLRAELPLRFVEFIEERMTVAMPTILGGEGKLTIVYTLLASKLGKI